MMNQIDFPIERINQFFDNHIFEVVTQPTHDENHNITTNIKVKLTGVKNYISVGESIPHVEYTLYILDGDRESNMWNGLYGEVYGSDIPISTTDNVYYQLRFAMDRKLSDFLMYFGVDMPVICNRVVNTVKSEKLINTEKDKNNLTFEHVIRNWFKKNPNKHNLTIEQKEEIIQRILSEK